MIRCGFLEVDPALLAWVLRESGSTRSINMSTTGKAWHRQDVHVTTSSTEFLREAITLTEEPTPLKKARWWANVLGNGAEYKPHRHDGKWAFVYHLTEGAAIHFGTPDAITSFPASPGQLIVFDSKLPHWTDKVEGDAPRVSIAGNLHFKRD
jgi:hypothetical protein